MAFNSTFAEIRFGCGLSPRVAAARSVDAMIDRLAGPDVMAARFPIEPFTAFQPKMIELRNLRVAKRKGTMAPKEAREATATLRRGMRMTHLENLRAWIGRASVTEDGLRERLTYFWADHFTAQGEGKGPVMRYTPSAYVEEAIRPRVTGKFRDLLLAAVTHPQMLVYLDQFRSVGPNSTFAKRKGQEKRGLNENLAREVMELHTLGVGGPYAQNDVRQLAELFTGMTFDPKRGFNFNVRRAEPGAETVLGKGYGGGRAMMQDIHKVLADLARHPDTARHIAWKLAVHFVSDQPDPALTDALAARYMATDGDLLEVTRALLEHPAAWSEERPNIKPPFWFMASGLRALGLSQERLMGWDLRRVAWLIKQPMGRMGQVWEGSPGPDGFPEEDMHWVTPQGMAARLQWAMTAPIALTGKLPDPRKFVVQALGERASDTVRFAARAAENRYEGVALVLASPDFQRT